MRVDAYATTKDGARIEDLYRRRTQVPVPTSVRDEADGSKSHSATLALASLATGDYLIELIAGQRKGPPRTLIAFRVVP